MKQFKIGSSNLLVDAIASIGGNNLITLYVPSGVSVGNYQTLQRDITGAVYQVTTGKTLYIVAAQVQMFSTAGTYADFGYGDTSVANAAGAPTNSKSLLPGFFSNGLVNNSTYIVPLWVCVPATKYPYIKNGAGNNPNSCIFWCFEE